MQTQNLELKAGRIVVFSEGSYSDFDYCGHFVCLKDFSQEQMLELETKLKREEKTSGEYGYAINNFIPSLIREGLLACIDVQEIHLGECGKLELS